MASEKTQDTPSEKLLIPLKRKANFTLDDARSVGISHPTLLRLVKRGKVTRLARGLYSVAGLEPIGETADYAVATKKLGPKAVIGGLTALSHYELIDEVPTQLWVLVPPSIRTTDKKYRLLRTKRNLTIGIEKTAHYRIVSIERALVDALLYSTKIGLRIATTAIVRAIRDGKTTESKLFSIAKKLDALSVLESRWEIILGGLKT